MKQAGSWLRCAILAPLFLCVSCVSGCPYRPTGETAEWEGPVACVLVILVGVTAFCTIVFATIKVFYRDRAWGLVVLGAFFSLLTLALLGLLIYVFCFNGF